MKTNWEMDNNNSHVFCRKTYKGKGNSKNEFSVELQCVCTSLTSASQKLVIRCVGRSVYNPLKGFNIT